MSGCIVSSNIFASARIRFSLSCSTKYMFCSSVKVVKAMVKCCLTYCPSFGSIRTSCKGANVRPIPIPKTLIGGKLWSRSCDGKTFCISASTCFVATHRILKLRVIMVQPVCLVTASQTLAMMLRASVGWGLPSLAGVLANCNMICTKQTLLGGSSTGWAIPPKFEFYDPARANGNKFAIKCDPSPQTTLPWPKLWIISVEHVLLKNLRAHHANMNQ